MDYIENYLKKKLIDAIGRSVTPVDFGNYMNFHCKKRFLPPYAPKPFSYIIRKKGSDADGTISIEDLEGNSVQTFCDTRPTVTPLTFQLNSAVSVKLRGEQHCHFWFRSQFADATSENFLRIRGRSYGVTLVVAGKMMSSDRLQPEIAILVTNGCSIEIPVRFPLSVFIISCNLCFP